MANAKKFGAHDKVLYVEPNYNMKTANNENVKSPYFIHDYEDYSIYVDLMVEVYDRKVVTGVDASDTKTIICSWRAGDGTDVSFMSGHKMNLDGKDGKFSILTTDCMDTYYGDVVKNSATGSNAQTFGIESINISYNNYSVPQVTIQFTDIRGVSLFSPEELRHNKSYNGVGGFANEDIAGSFFKCFFTFPYPRFTLMVKGFYGQPVSYELTCAKFNAKFNAATGSFGATAELVGYAYSLLNDVSLNALLAAPLSDYIGMSYWVQRGGAITNDEIKSLERKEEVNITDENGQKIDLSNIANNENTYGKFIIDGHVPMPTINQIIDKLRNIKNIPKIPENQELQKNMNIADAELTKIESAEQIYNDFFYQQYNKINVPYKFKTPDNSGFLALITKEETVTVENGKISTFRLDSANDLIDKLKSVLNDDGFASTLNNSVCVPIPRFIDGVESRMYSINTHSHVPSGLLDLFKDSVEEHLEEEQQKDSEILYTHCVYLDGTEFLKWVKDKKELYASNRDKYAAQSDELRTRAIQDILGFQPTIYNIMKIVMAHLETLLHIMYKATSEAQSSNRKLSDFNYSRQNNKSGLRIAPNEVEANEDTLGAWPKIVEKSLRNNNGYVDTWIGSIRKSSLTQATPEENVVNGLLNGISTIANTISNVNSVLSQTVEETTENNESISSRVKLPLDYLDFIFKGNPFGENSLTVESDMHQFYDIIAKMHYRMKAIMWGQRAAGLSTTKIQQLGSFDAMNFYDLFFEGSVVNEKTQELLTAVTVDDIIEIIKTNKYKGKEIETTYSKLWDANENNSLEIVANNLEEQGVIPMQNVSYAEALNFVNTKEGDVNNYILTDNSKRSFNPKETKYDNFIIKYNDVRCFDNIKFVGEELLNKSQKQDYVSQYEELCEEIFKPKFNSAKLYTTEGVFTNDYESVNSWHWITEKFGNYTIPEYYNSDITLGYHLTVIEDGSTPSELKDANGNGVIKKDNVSSFPCELPIDNYPNDKKTGRKLKREELKSFAEIYKEIEDNDFSTTVLTVPCVQYYNNFATDKCWDSLFTSSKYYSLDNDYAKGFLFLDNLRCHDVSRCFMQLNANPSQGNGNKTIYTPERIFKCATEVSVLLAGAYLMRGEMNNEGSEYTSILSDEIFQNNKNQRLKPNKDAEKNPLLKSYEDFEKLANPYLKKYLIDYFKKWVESAEEGYGFQYFKKQFELQVGGKTLSISELNDFKKALLEGGNSLKGWFDKLDNNFFDNYSYIRKHYVLMNNENAEAVHYLTKFYIKPSLIVYPLSNSLLFTKPDFKNRSVKEKSYIIGFFSTLSELINSAKEKAKEEQKQIAQMAKDAMSPDDIKTELYRYLKNLHDKWLGGTSFENWKLDEFFEKHFDFIDSYYNDIGNYLHINLEDIFEIVLKSETQRGFSLISFICALLEKNHVMFHCVQNFINLKDGEWQKKMNQMFSPIPYLEMEVPSMIPHFVSIFTSEPSSKLNIEGGEYPDDSFMLDYGNETNWPEAIKNKYSSKDNEVKDLPIPAFGVSYGSQYQSYFNDISVGMDGSMITEQALQAQYEIAGMHGQKENAEEVYTLGQDLFTVYANQSYKCDVTMMGCPWIQPLMYFVLNNIPLFRGSYLIQKVNHSLSPGKMTTTFTGVRMANTATPFIKDVVHLRINDVNTKNGNGGDSSNTKKKDNCPEYMEFDVKPIINGSTASGIDPNILSEENGYAKYGCTDNDPTAYTTILDALTSTAIAEAGNQDELGIRLVIAVMFSRWKLHGGDFRNIFKPGQTAYIEGKAYSKDKYKNKDKWDRISTYVEDMFINTPVPSLVGRTTTVEKSVNIWNDNVMSSQMTSPVVITEEMVEKLYMYCTTRGYSKENPYLNLPRDKKTRDWYKEHEKEIYGGYEEFPEDFHSTEYILHHKGHVLTSGPHKGKGKIHYKYEPVQASSEENSENNILSAFVNALQESVNSTKEISYDISFETVKNESNKIVLTTNNKEQRKTLFDLILNGYFNYFSELTWVAESENDVLTENNPYAIIVKVTEGLSDSHSIRIGYYVDKTNYSVSYIQSVDESSVNEGFLKSVAKHYREDLKSMGKDCYQISENKLSEISNKYGCNISQNVSYEENAVQISDNLTIIETPYKNNSRLKTRTRTEEIILHCAATPEGANYTVQTINDWHINQNKWTCIGYNFYIDLYGNIFEGRGERMVGAHCEGHNSNTIGICYCGGMDGNNEKSKDTRTPEQKESLYVLVDYLLKKYNLFIDNVKPHHAYAAKACPSFKIETFRKEFIEWKQRQS